MAGGQGVCGVEAREDGASDVEFAFPVGNKKLFKIFKQGSM